MVKKVGRLTILEPVERSIMIKVVQPIGIAYATVVTAYVFPVIPFKKVLRAKKVQVRAPAVA